MSHINVPLNLVSVSYVLTSSVYPNGQTVAYQYQKTNHRSYHKNFSFQAPYASSGTSRFLGDGYYSTSEAVYEGTEFYLTRMGTTNYEVTFELADRIDIQNGYRLHTMKVRSKTTHQPFERDFHFRYDYYTASSIGPKWRPMGGDAMEDYVTKRLRLDAVYQQSGTATNERYEFTYDSTPLPEKYSYQTDYWGYYNGKGNRSTYLPDLKNLKWGHTLGIGNYDEICNLMSKYGYNTHSNDRGASYTYAKAGILTGIKYPTGGYTQFTYESNSFLERSQVNSGAKTISVKDQNQTPPSNYAYFTLETPTEVEIEFAFTRGTASWLDVWKGGAGGGVIMHGTNVVKSYSFSDDCQYYANHHPNESYIIKKDKLHLESHSPASGAQLRYYFQANISNNFGNQNGASTNHITMTGTLSYKEKIFYKDMEYQGCGVRIRKIDFYQQKGDATPLKSVSYEYKDPSTGESSGILMEQVQMVKPYTGTFSYLRDLAVTGTNYVLARLNVAEITGSNIISNPYGTVGGVGYSYVKEIHTNNGLTAGYTEYRYHNKRPTFTLTSVRLDDPANGKPISITHCDSQGQVKSSESYTYQIKDVHHYFGVNVRDNFNMFPGIYSREPQVRLESYENDKGYYPGRMTILLHQLNAYDVTLQNKTVRTDGVSVREEYGYDASTLQLTQRQRSATGSDLLTYRYSYPNHYHFAPYTRLTQENRVHRPVEEKVLRNGNLIEATLTEYQVFGNSNLVLPARRYVSQITGQTGNPTTYTASGPLASVYPYWSASFERYDLRGNPRQIRTTDGPETVYLWGYNYQYPVAKIEGATFEQAKNLLTESYINSLATNQAITAATAAEIRNKLTSLPALVTTYVYKPHTGLLSTILPHGDTFTYQYDPFGRLLKITDRSGKAVEEYQYNYKP
ncbi:MAG: RHS repeat protein [Bacteroides sp.]|nr:RHS repeat protein [Bacteroides sp.]